MCSSDLNMTHVKFPRGVGEHRAGVLLAARVLGVVFDHAINIARLPVGLYLRLNGMGFVTVRKHAGLPMVKQNPRLWLIGRVLQKS